MPQRLHVPCPCCSHWPQAGRNAEGEGTCRGKESRGQKAAWCPQLLVEFHGPEAEGKSHTHTHTHHPTVQSVSRCRHFSSLLFLLPGPLLSCFTWLGTRASSLPFLRCQREPVKTYNPPPPSSAQNPPMTASALRVKDKGLLWPWMNLPHHLSSPPRLYQPRCSWASQAYTLASGPLPWLFPLPGPLVPACLPSFQHGSLPPSPPSSFCSKGSFSALCLPSINPLKYGPLFTYPVSCLLSSLQWTRAVIFLFCSLQMLPGT